MSEFLFHPTQVNRLIPELEVIMKRIKEMETEIQEKVIQLKQARVKAKLRGAAIEEDTFLREEAEVDFLRILMRGQLDRVREMGGEIKTGYLVDFPARIDGRDVLLCWKPGESSVCWYHGRYEGAMSRKPIPNELMTEEP